eukprot:CAMPEP_0170544278 /NCGR_PEP_ID=MMETSP0211-20121228/3104_1 /TAXON_ID=311385 /ORGANISM="Pseudokeronopsis sp., Strain OXSARD2" /LENGTH=85 /DNA_ID=CAMNT_0010847897 /DNA_START=306 /DNA_END=563 /DNA_ORIENTATION=-
MLDMARQHYTREGGIFNLQPENKFILNNELVSHVDVEGERKKVMSSDEQGKFVYACRAPNNHLPFDSGVFDACIANQCLHALGDK